MSGCVRHLLRVRRPPAEGWSCKKGKAMEQLDDAPIEQARSPGRWYALFLLTALVAMVCVVVWVILREAKQGPSVDYGGEQKMYYVDGATEAEARQLGDYLRKEGFFRNGGGGRTVQLARIPDGYAVSFVLTKGHENDADVEEATRRLGQRISALVFEGKAIEIRLCDGHMAVIKSFRVKLSYAEAYIKYLRKTHPATQPSSRPATTTAPSHARSANGESIRNARGMSALVPVNRRADRDTRS
jgi:hypothetical protein